GHERLRRRSRREGPAHGLQVPVEMREHVDERIEQLALSRPASAGGFEVIEQVELGQAPEPRPDAARGSLDEPDRAAPAQLDPDVLAPAANAASRLDGIALLRSGARGT